mgnify:CR=1 FL=1
MAPTGRAAKVMGAYAGKKAFTIHKQIYYTKSEGGSGMQFTLKPNKFKDTLFVVDEASMIGDDRQNTKLFENGSLLGDLMQYVDAGNNCWREGNCSSAIIGLFYEFQCCYLTSNYGMCRGQFRRR